MKILICGAAGFLMSNLIRYMLYRTKDYEFVSVDKLSSINDYKKVYQNRKHTFYVGDAGNKDFMERIIVMEKPDVAILGTAPLMETSKSDLIKDLIAPISVISDLSKFSHMRVIQLSPDFENDICFNISAWEYVELIINEINGTILRLPECFGMRGHGEFEQIIKMLLHGKIKSEPSKVRRRYAYAEDVASMIWYLLEKDLKGIITMPSLGVASPFDLVSFSSYIHKLNITTDNIPVMEVSKVEGWLPDSSSLVEAAIKTVQWYTMNKWVFNM